MTSDRSWVIRCINCGATYRDEPQGFQCQKCGDLLEIVLKEAPSESELFPRRGLPGVWRYAAALPSVQDPVTLNEGGTPLVTVARVAGGAGLLSVFLKNEGQNPTGSFKDRGMTVAISHARRRGAKTLLCASTGNTSASLAAYASRAGMRAVVLVPSGKVARGKLVQAVAYGARIVRVEGDFDKALRVAMKAASSDSSVYLMNSVNPFRIEGQKTCAYEIFEQLDNMVPDFVVLPVGNAGNISALWKGFKELKAWGIAKKLPRMVGVQASGASPIAEAYRRGAESVRRWKSPETVASAIRIGNPVSWRKALGAIRESAGLSMAVTDAEILEARRALAEREGIFVEAASAAPVAALARLRGKIPPNARVVCVATGNGLKDQESVSVEPESWPVVDNPRSLSRAISG